jgi:hypothetical protein
MALNQAPLHRWPEALSWKVGQAEPPDVPRRPRPFTPFSRSATIEEVFLEEYLFRNQYNLHRVSEVAHNCTSR